MPLLQWMFAASEVSSRGQVVAWWERPVSVYNAVLLIIGSATWIAVRQTGPHLIGSGADLSESFTMIAGPVLYAVAANVLYQLGPALDAAFLSRRPRIWLFKAGLAFAMLLTALPGVVAVRNAAHGVGPRLLESHSPVSR